MHNITVVIGDDWRVAAVPGGNNVSSSTKGGCPRSLAFGDRGGEPSLQPRSFAENFPPMEHTEGGRNVS